MRKASTDEIIGRLKDRKKVEERANVTFRLKKRLMDDFRVKCRKREVSLTEVVEELISEFLRG